MGLCTSARTLFQRVPCFFSIIVLLFVKFVSFGPTVFNVIVLIFVFGIDCFSIIISQLLDIALGVLGSDLKACIARNPTDCLPRFLTWAPRVSKANLLIWWWDSVFFPIFSSLQKRRILLFDGVELSGLLLDGGSLIAAHFFQIHDALFLVLLYAQRDLSGIRPSNYKWHWS